MLTVEKIEEAKSEALRFLERIEKFKKAHPEQFKKGSTKNWFYASREGGSLKRASMDLTNSLVELRK